jgi:hypothetical protein
MRRRLCSDLQTVYLKEITHMIDLVELPRMIEGFLAGKSHGQVVLRVSGD